MIDRFQQANQSNRDTLSLIADGHYSEKTAEVMAAMRNIAASSDYLGFNPYDNNLEPTVTEFTAGGVRPDFGLLPPSAYFFQAMPEDVNNFPDIIYDNDPRFYAVIHKSVGLVMKSEAVPSIEDPEGDCRPLVLMAYCDHPLTQAILGVDALSKLYGSVFSDVPLTNDGVNLTTFRNLGISRLNSSRAVISVLKANDECGDVTEWLEDSTEIFASNLEENKYARLSAPPDTTVLAEAASYEPMTTGLLHSYIATEGVMRYGIRKGYSMSQAAILTSKLLDE